MKVQSIQQGTRLSRRRAISLATALGTGAALGTAPFRSALTQDAAQTEPGASGDYARPEALIGVTGLQRMMQDDSVVVVGFMPPEEFEAARIPGSVQINAPELEVIDTSDASIGGWHQEVRKLLGNLGISPDSTVVIYDNGTLFGARLWWILRYLGHENVHVLNGGLAAWQEAGNDVESGPVEAPPGGDPYHGTPHFDLLAQIDEVMASLVSPNAVILDARKPEEYAEGHIPGAVNINFPLNAAPEPPKFWKPADELRSMYDEAGVTADKLVIPYCASGVRSAVTAFTLHLLGYDDVALYTGSWLEWGEHPNTPKTEGDTP